MKKPRPFDKMLELYEFRMSLIMPIEDKWALDEMAELRAAARVLRACSTAYVDEYLVQISFPEDEKKIVRAILNARKIEEKNHAKH
jgi:hypothetical protein